MDLSDMPVKVRGIRQPTWTDILLWRMSDQSTATTEVDHDWRLWVDLKNGKAFVRNKGLSIGESFPNLDEALASLDYRRA